MKRVSILLLVIVSLSALGILETHEIMELSLFLLLLMLSFALVISLTRYIQRYLIRRKIEKDFKNVFTDEFYSKLTKTILKMNSSRYQMTNYVLDRPKRNKNDLHDRLQQMSFDEIKKDDLELKLMEKGVFLSSMKKNAYLKKTENCKSLSF